MKEAEVELEESDDTLNNFYVDSDYETENESKKHKLQRRNTLWERFRKPILNWKILVNKINKEQSVIQQL